MRQEVWVVSLGKSPNSHLLLLMSLESSSLLHLPRPLLAVLRRQLSQQPEDLRRQRHQNLCSDLSFGLLRGHLHTALRSDLPQRVLLRRKQPPLHRQLHAQHHNHPLPLPAQHHLCCDLSHRVPRGQHHSHLRYPLPQQHLRLPAHRSLPKPLSPRLLRRRFLSDLLYQLSHCHRLLRRPLYKPLRLPMP